jgi:AraC-like DNA-binding protein
MLATPTRLAPPAADPSRPTTFALQSPGHADADGVIAHFVKRDVLRPERRATSYVRSILAAPPEALRVDRIARRVYASRRTIGRHMRAEGLPAPVDWVALARAIGAHRTILRGGPLRVAAAAAGYPDQFTMSNAIYRIIGIRPSQLRNVSREELLDVWIQRQRERGNLTDAPPAPLRSCPLCGGLRAS